VFFFGGGLCVEGELADFSEEVEFLLEGRFGFAGEVGFSAGVEGTKPLQSEARSTSGICTRIHAVATMRRNAVVVS
jgi:hypothetical protein